MGEDPPRTSKDPPGIIRTLTTNHRSLNFLGLCGPKTSLKRLPVGRWVTQTSQGIMERRSPELFSPLPRRIMEGSSSGHQNSSLQGFPVGSMDKSSPCQCRGLQFDPQTGKIPHAMEKLSLCVLQLLSPCTTTEACAHSRSSAKRSHYSEKPKHPHQE